MALWEVQLDGQWKALDTDVVDMLNGLSPGTVSGDVRSRGQTYRYDTKEMTQTNVGSGKARPIRKLPVPLLEETTNVVSTYSASPTATQYNVSFAGSLKIDRTKSTLSQGGATPKHRLQHAFTTLKLDDATSLEVAQVWLAGEWKNLDQLETSEIARRRQRGDRRFKVQSRAGIAYEIDLEHMTRTNTVSGRARTIRFASASFDPSVGFEEFRSAFRERTDKSSLSQEMLRHTWPAVEHAEALADATVKLVLADMGMRGNGSIDMMEWNHYWALERDNISFAASKEANVKLREAIRKDPQVLGRMQMHFETAVCEAGSEGRLSSSGLIRVCERLVASPKPVIERQWAAELLEKQSSGEDVLDEEDTLCYYDFLNVMLGRKKFRVTLWMYDISEGAAKQWSWLLLGQSFEGIWHTGVVVDWPGKTSEFWFGGSLFESAPGTTPFGEPVEKRFLGYTYKLREESWNHIARSLAHEFTHQTYDVLTHNCNHFSDKLSLYLLNEHIPDEVRLQPDLVMSTVTARALRPLLNRWLGGFGDKQGRATDGGKAADEMWEAVLPGAIIEFSKEDGGRPMVGEVVDVNEEACEVICLDFWHRREVRREVPRVLMTKVVTPAPPGTKKPLHVQSLEERDTPAVVICGPLPWF